MPALGREPVRSRKWGRSARKISSQLWACSRSYYTFPPRPNRPGHTTRVFLVTEGGSLGE